MTTCEKCGTKLQVKEVRHYQDETYRRVACPNCGAFIFTVEFEVEQNSLFFKYWQKAGIERLKSKIKNEREKDGVTN